MGRRAYLLLPAALLIHCSSSKSTCTPGSQVACTCVGGGVGAQVCQPDGQSYGTCACASGTTSTGGSTGGTTGTGSTGTSSTGGNSSGSTTGGQSALGQACSPSNACPASAPLCITLMGSLCTLPCGVGAQPPDGGDAICLGAGSATGTPACVIQTPSDAGPSQFFWTCGVTCGTYNSMELGSCPSQLTCTNNVCQ